MPSMLVLSQLRSDRASGLRAVLAGAGAGLVATVVMSGAMGAFQRLGLLGRMPPRHIVEHVLARMGIHHRTSRGTRKALSAISHLGFGASQGALYALGHEVHRALTDGAPCALAQARSTGGSGAMGRRGDTVHPGVSTAVPFALLVWAVSYAGWIPKLGILPAPSRDRFGRPTSMILAHAVYGVVLGALSKRSWTNRV